MKNKIIVDTNFLLHLYNPDNFGATWSEEYEEIFSEILNCQDKLYITPIVLQEYIMVLHKQYMKIHSLTFHNLKKDKQYLSIYNKPISFIQLLLQKKDKFIYLSTWERPSVEHFKMVGRYDEVDNWLIISKFKVATFDKEINKNISNERSVFYSKNKK